MSSHPSQERTGPPDCALAIALPVTHSEFKRDAEAEGKDFVRSWSAQFEGLSCDFAWQQYKPYADLVVEVSHKVSADGVTVKLPATLADWVGLLQQVRVVTLLAHCRRAGASASQDDAIEFSDGLYRPAQIVEAMPKNYAGVLDLTVCYSLDLAPHIKRRFPHCTTIVNKQPARLDNRIAMYRQAIWLLKTGSYSYVDALAEVQLAVLRKAKTATHNHD